MMVSFAGNAHYAITVQSGRQNITTAPSLWMIIVKQEGNLLPQDIGDVDTSQKKLKKGMINTILFQPEHVQPIHDGIKVKTRRNGKKRWNVNTIHKAKTVMMSKDYFALLRILTLHQEPLGAMTETDAREEGGYTLEEYKAEWERINGEGSWDPELVVWVVQFERVFNLDEICKKCWAQVGCVSGTCCIRQLFDSREYITPKEIVEFCCRQRCRHSMEYHEKSCPIKLSGAGTKYLAEIKVVQQEPEKDDKGYIVKRLTDYV